MVMVIAVVVVMMGHECIYGYMEEICGGGGKERIRRDESMLHMYI
jgi:hypothetical protein